MHGVIACWLAGCGGWLAGWTGCAGPAALAGSVDWLRWLAGLLAGLAGWLRCLDALGCAGWLLEESFGPFWQACNWVCDDWDDRDSEGIWEIYASIYIVDAAEQFLSLFAVGAPLGG